MIKGKILTSDLINGEQFQEKGSRLCPFLLITQMHYPL
ncbi:hypothetical protein BSM4216_0645 [Bacillus smithii]|nr:hypothetical protein BSM4216_0645 [Bacillus smithii]